MGKLNIRFHNPNTKEDSIRYISRIFIEASKAKFENALREVAATNHVINTKITSPEV